MLRRRFVNVCADHLRVQETQTRRRSGGTPEVDLDQTAAPPGDLCGSRSEVREKLFSRCVRPVARRNLWRAEWNQAAD